LETETIEMDDWILRYRMPDDSRPVSVYLMIHGWTGDETVMWLFANRLPLNFLKIAPRGLYPAQMVVLDGRRGSRRVGQMWMICSLPWKKL
jgi:hypothetical protein